jgi:hypothetical protein
VPDADERNESVPVALAHVVSNQFSRAFAALPRSKPIIQAWMASANNTAPHSGGDYDVFISHCGADCKRDFAVWLKKELQRVGLRCFFDEHSLRVGDAAAERMLQAMEEAKYGILILTPGFF